MVRSHIDKEHFTKNLKQYTLQYKKPGWLYIYIYIHCYTLLFTEGVVTYNRSFNTTTYGKNSLRYVGPSLWNETFKGVVRSKIGYVKVDGLGGTLRFTRTKSDKLAEIWGVQNNSLKTRFLSGFGWPQKPNTKYVTEQSINQIRQIEMCRPIGSRRFSHTTKFEQAIAS